MLVTNPPACTTWDDPERLPENRRGGTAGHAHALQDYIWRMLLNRRNGHGGNPADRQRSNGFASGSGWARPPASMVKLPLPPRRQYGDMVALIPHDQAPSAIVSSLCLNDSCSEETS